MRSSVHESFSGVWRKLRICGEAALFALAMMSIIPAAMVYADFSEPMTNAEFLAVPATGDSGVFFSTVDIIFSNNNYQYLYYSLTGVANSWHQIALTPEVPGYMEQGSFSISGISGSQAIYFEITNADRSSILTSGTLDFAGPGTGPNSLYNSVSIGWGNSASATLITPISSNEAGVGDKVAPISSSSTQTGGSVPIPSSAILFGSALILLISLDFWRLRRRPANSRCEL
jgi:hypothetical protein